MPTGVVLLIDPCMHFNIPNDYKIEKTYVSCFDGETASLWICCSQFNLCFHNGCYETLTVWIEV